MSDSSFPLWLIKLTLNETGYPEKRGLRRKAVVPATVIDAAVCDARIVSVTDG